MLLYAELSLAFSVSLSSPEGKHPVYGGNVEERVICFVEPSFLGPFESID